MVSGTLIALGIGSAVFVGGLALLWGAFRVHRFANRLNEAEPLSSGTSPGTLTVVEGTIEEPLSGDPLESDWSGNPCVGYITRKTKQEGIPGPHDPDPDASTGTPRTQRDQEVIGFLLDTDLGPVQVDADDDALLMVGNDQFETVTVGEVKENRGLLVAAWWFLRTLATSTDQSVDRQYHEALFRPGDRVLVHGEFSRAGPSRHAIEPPGGGPLIVSRDLKGSAADRYTSRRRGRLIWGGLFVVVGGWFLAKLAGLL